MTTDPQRSHADALRWVQAGSRLLLDGVAALDEEAFAAPSALPGWTRKHLVAHVAANAEALMNLARWAATGVETPMYASPEQRNADIEAGSTRPGDELAAWAASSAAALDAALARLDEAAWAAEVRTAQGRLVPATEIPWMRAREVCVHAVDLDRGVGFGDLPEDFLAALVADITAQRGLPGLPDGPLPEVAAWLAGRSHHLADAPALGPWL